MSALPPPVVSSPQFTFTLPAPPAPERPKPRYSKALWVVALALLINAGVFWARGAVPDIVLDRTALAQAAPGGGGQPMLGARGIYMMPAQLGPNAYGLYLLDVDSSTICVYQALPEQSRFRLMASRTFKYDRFLENYNNDALRPSDVQKIVEAQNQRADLHQKDDVPTVDQTTKPSDNTPDTPK